MFVGLLGGNMEGFKRGSEFDAAVRKVAEEGFNGTG